MENLASDKHAWMNISVEFKFTFEMTMSQMEPLNGIRTFVISAKTGSFTAAAVQLGVSKTAVGKSVARLEERLGVKLFHRTTRRSALTAEGEAYFLTCSSALDDIQAMEEVLASRTELPSGRLRVDLPSAYGRQTILPILLQMTQKYPQLNLTVTFSDYLIDPVEEGVDLLVRFGNLKDTSALVARSLGHQKLIICATPAYLNVAGIPTSIESLMLHRCIVGYRRGQLLNWSLLNGKFEAVRIAPPATQQMGDGEAILAAALADCGLCQLPQFLLETHVARGTLIPVLEELSTEIEVNLVWPKTRHMLPKVRRVVDEITRLCEEGSLGLESLQSP